MDLSPTNIVESLTCLTVGAGTTTIVKTIIKDHVPTETLISKITVNAAAFVIGAMAASETRKYTRAQIQGIVKAFREANEQTEEPAETETVETTTEQ